MRHTIKAERYFDKCGGDFLDSEKMEIAFDAGPEDWDEKYLTIEIGEYRNVVVLKSDIKKLLAVL